MTLCFFLSSRLQTEWNQMKEEERKPFKQAVEEKVQREATLYSSKLLPLVKEAQARSPLLFDVSIRASELRGTNKRYLLLEYYLYLALQCHVRLTLEVDGKTHRIHAYNYPECPDERYVLTERDYVECLLP